jgi:nucleoside-diphosphate-sugar epimerase
MTDTLPETIRTEEELEEVLSRPWPRLVESMASLKGDLVILGAGGKIGPSLARTAARAVEAAGVKHRVIGVDLFPEPGAREKLEAVGVETVQCDLLDREAVAKLPDAAGVIFMAGKKFGTQGAVETTWAMNAMVPYNAAERYAKRPVVVFSTGCVYPLVGPESCGSREEDAPAPVGEYAQSSLARERVWGFYSRAQETPVLLFRLNYAVELRYGVLFDIASQILNGEPVNDNVGQFNVLWQGDVNNLALLSLEAAESPAAILNVTGPEMLSTRAAAAALGELLGKEVAFAGSPGPVGYLSDSTRAVERFGYPSVPPRRIIRWLADWLRHGGGGLGKPTHFEVSDGKY